jgi:hypothetical protein
MGWLQVVILPVIDNLHQTLALHLRMPTATNGLDERVPGASKYYY